METLVAVEHRRYHYYMGSRNSYDRDGFGSLPSRGFRDINCRGFEAGMGLLPSPFKGYESPLYDRGLLSPKPQTPCAKVSGNWPFGGSNGVKSKSVDVKQSRKLVKTSPIVINFKEGSGSKKERQLMANRSLSERWAGPAYSNSPPPSSLPMPKFEMKPKRTVSLELPALKCDLNLPLMSMSAPSSPTRVSVSSSDDFYSDDDFATKTLRRILNLDIIED